MKSSLIIIENTLFCNDESAKRPALLHFLKRTYTHAITKLIRETRELQSVFKNKLFDNAGVDTWPIFVSAGFDAYLDMPEDEQVVVKGFINEHKVSNEEETEDMPNIEDFARFVLQAFSHHLVRTKTIQMPELIRVWKQTNLKYLEESWNGILHNPVGLELLPDYTFAGLIRTLWTACTSFFEQTDDNDTTRSEAYDADELVNHQDYTGIARHAELRSMHAAWATNRVKEILYAAYTAGDFLSYLDERTFYSHLAAAEELVALAVQAMLSPDVRFGAIAFPGEWNCRASLPEILGVVGNLTALMAWGV